MIKFLKRNVLYLISYVDILAVSLIIPLFNQHLQSIGISNVKIGLLGSIYSGVQFFASPLIGHLSDVYGSKYVLIVSLLICACCYPVMGLVTSFVSIVLIRGVVGFTKHTQLLCKNYIQESTGEKEHFRSFGKLNGYTSLGYIIGPIIGGYLIDTENGFTYMCYFTGFLFALNAAIACYLSTGGLRQSSEHSTTNFISSFRNIPWPICWDLFVLKCLSVFAMFSFYMNYNKSITSRYGTTSVLIGYSLSLQGLVRASTAFSIHKIFRMFPKNVSISEKMQIIYAALIVSFSALYLSNSFNIFLIFLIPLNICLCFIRIINHDALVERIKEHNKGIILGAFNNVTAICRFILPLFSGYVIDTFGYDGSYVVSLLSLIAGLVTISCCNRIRRKAE